MLRKSIQNINGITKLLILLEVIISAFFWFNGGNEKRVFYGDALGYYTYLPAYFIHDALDNVDSLSTIDAIPKKTKFGLVQFKDHYQKNSEGKTIIQYTYGVAAFSTPFFFIARIYDCILGNCGTGYESIYQYWIKISSIFYGILGFLFLFLSLSRVYSKNSSLQAVTVLYIGSNILWFMIIQAGMSHVISFFLISLLIYLSLIYYERKSNLGLFFIGLTVGFITLVRPTDLIFILIPFIINVYDRTSFNNRIDILSKKWKSVLFLGVIGFTIPIIPQLLYWHMMTGNWIFNSYGETGFNWFSPRITEGLFGPKNGWWMYSPLLFLPTLFVYIKRYSKVVFLPAAIILPIYIYYLFLVVLQLY